jgi:hypothetical protein
MIYHKMPQGVKYVSYTDETANLYGTINKTNKGNGCTHREIHLKNHSIIFFPTRALVESKRAGFRHYKGALWISKEPLPTGAFVLAIFVDQRVSYKDVQQAMDIAKREFGLANDGVSGCPIKIIGTYDAAVKLTSWMGFVDAIFVDEWHRLTTDYGFRNKAIKDLKRALKPWKSKIRAYTATPVEACYMNTLLESLEQHEFVYEREDLDIRNVHISFCNNAIGELVNVLKGYATTGVVKSADYTFVGATHLSIALNSTEKNVASVGESGLASKDVNFCFSRTLLNEAKVAALNNEIDDAFDIGSPELGAKKMIDMFTSYADEGVDFIGPRDKKSLAIVVLDFRAFFGLKDIKTAVSQAIARVRGTEVKDVLVLVALPKYVKNEANEKVKFSDHLNALEAAINSKYEKAKKFVESDLDMELKMAFYTGCEYAEGYEAVSFENGELVLDEDAYRAAMYNLVVSKRAYESEEAFVNAWDKEKFNVYIHRSKAKVAEISFKTNATPNTILEKYCNHIDPSVDAELAPSQRLRFEDKNDEEAQVYVDIVEKFGIEYVREKKHNYNWLKAEMERTESWIVKIIATELRAMYLKNGGKAMKQSEVLDKINVVLKFYGLKNNGTRGKATKEMLLDYAKGEFIQVNGERFFVPSEFNDGLTQSLSEALKQAEQANDINSHKKAAVEPKNEPKQAPKHIQASIKFGVEDSELDYLL